MANPEEQAVVRSQEIYRLKTEIESSGDIFELNESTLALYVGPDSDLAELLVQYFDPNTPSNLQTAVVSVNGPFVGRVDSLPFTKIPTTGQAARILISPNDIIDNSYVDPLSLAFRRFNVKPQIDVIASLKPPTTVPSVRADRTLRFAKVPFENKPTTVTDDGSTDLVIPIYGRRMCSVTIATLTTGVIARASIVSLQPGENAEPQQLGSVSWTSANPAVQQIRTMVIRASDAARQGRTYAADGVTINGFYEESDQPSNIDQGAISGAVAPEPLPRGTADLLIVNIAGRAIGAQATRYADVYVKLMDRET